MAETEKGDLGRKSPDLKEYGIYNVLLNFLSGIRTQFPDLTTQMTNHYRDVLDLSEGEDIISALTKKILSRESTDTFSESGLNFLRSARDAKLHFVYEKPADIAFNIFFEKLKEESLFLSAYNYTENNEERFGLLLGFTHDNETIITNTLSGIYSPLTDRLYQPRGLQIKQAQYNRKINLTQIPNYTPENVIF